MELSDLALARRLNLRGEKIEQNPDQIEAQRQGMNEEQVAPAQREVDERHHQYFFLSLSAIGGGVGGGEESSLSVSFWEIDCVFDLVLVTFTSSLKTNGEQK